MRNKRWRFERVLAFLWISVVALPAAAAPPPPSRLDRLLAEGAALTAQGSAACAAPLEAALLAADDVQHGADDYARALGALGLCREVGGRYGEAHRLVSRALEGAPAETTAAGRAPRWTSLRAALRRLDDRVARVMVMFDGDLWIDGKAVAAVSGAVLAVDPGRRLFEQRGKAPGAKEVEARAGDLPTVDLRTQGTFSPQKDPSPPVVKAVAPVVTTSPFAPALSPRGVAVTVAYTGLGVAAVSGVVAGVLEAQRSALASRLAPGACVDRTAPGCAELRLAFEQRTGARNVALVAGGVGLAASGVAVGLYFAGDRAPAVGVITVGGRW